VKEDMLNGRMKGIT